MLRRGFKSWSERIAIEKRSLLGLRPADPLDPRQLATHLGIRIWTPLQVPGITQDSLHSLLTDDPDGWSAVTLRLPGLDLIIVNSAHSPARQASDLMHELAHVLLGHTPTRVDVSADLQLLLRTHDQNQEEEAAWLSGCLLLPRPTLLAVQRIRPTRELASQFGVSLEMMQYRLRVTGVEIQGRRSSHYSRQA